MWPFLRSLTLVEYKARRSDLRSDPAVQKVLVTTVLPILLVFAPLGSAGTK